MSAPPYSRFDTPGGDRPTQTGPQLPQVQFSVSPSEPNVTKTKRRAALVCGVIQVVIGVLFVIIGVIKAVKFIPVMGGYAFSGALFAILAGAFGIQSGRTAGKCPTIACMVLSILGSICFFVSMIDHALLLTAAEVYHSDFVQSQLNSMNNEMSDVNEIIKPWFGPLGQATYILISWPV